MYDVSNLGDDDIAVIGIGCKFPGAENMNEFWNNLVDGKECVSFFSKTELAEEGILEELYESPDYVNAGCVLDEIDKFDYPFFGYSKEDAELIDPQQRILLECAHESMENAGYPAEDYKGVVAVFSGTRTSTYVKRLAPIMAKTGTSRTFEAILGNTVDQACLRLSYAFNFNGPSIGIQTVCSTSLVGIHFGCESLLSRESDLALVGVSAITIPRVQGYLYDEEMILSPDGHCRAFDEKAAGCIPGNGVGAVVLKRASEAVKDRDHIYSIIKGTAVNNDGSAKIGYRAPSVKGQASVINYALQVAGVSSDSISYVEANGTGTFLGDSVEIEALTRAFNANCEKSYSCGIGSVKSNIGHLTHAAGMAGFIKTNLALKNKKIPKSLNCETPNSKLNESYFSVVQELQDWDGGERPRRAGVNAFAIGGTNAHVVLEESPAIKKGFEKEKWGGSNIFNVSAKNDGVLNVYIEKYLDYLNSDAEFEMEDLCFTANIGRHHYSNRKSFIVKSKKDLIEKLEKFLKTKSNSNKKFEESKVAFLFSGKPLMDLETFEFFYKTQSAFKDSIDSSLQAIQNILPSFPFTDFSEVIKKENILDSKLICFCIESALGKMWESWGINSAMVAGFGSGEYSCAFFSGVLSLSDAIKLILDEGDDLLGVKAGGYKADIDLSESVIDFYLCQNNSLIEKFPQIKALVKNDKSFLETINLCLLMGSTPEKEMLHEIVSADCAIQEFEGSQKNLRDQFLLFLGQLYERGLEINWNNFYSSSSFCRIPIPTYPFEKKYCWFENP